MKQRRRLSKNAISMLFFLPFLVLWLAFPLLIRCIPFSSPHDAAPFVSISLTRFSGTELIKTYIGASSAVLVEEEADGTMCFHMLYKSGNNWKIPFQQYSPIYSTFLADDALIQTVVLTDVDGKKYVNITVPIDIKDVTDNCGSYFEPYSSANAVYANNHRNYISYIETPSKNYAIFLDGDGYQIALE